MVRHISRRAALKVLALGAVAGCSTDSERDSGILEPLIEPEPGEDEAPESLPISYLATEQLQDILGAPMPGMLIVYGVLDGTIKLINITRVGADGLLPRISMQGDYSKIFVVGMIADDTGAVSSIVSYMPLLDFEHGAEFIGPLHLKVLRYDQLPQGFDTQSYTNYLQNLNWVDGDGRGVMHAIQFSVKDEVWTEVSGQYLRPFAPSLRDNLKLFIPDVSFLGHPLSELNERDRVIDGLAHNLRKFSPNLEVVVDSIGDTGPVRLLGTRYEVDPGYMVLSLERQHWQKPNGASIISIETAIGGEFQGELRGAFGSIYLTKQVTPELMSRITAKSAAQCVGLSGNAPLSIPRHLTLMTQGAFYHESPDEISEPEIIAFELANAYPARPGNDRRRPLEVLREVLPSDGQSVESLWDGTPAGLSASSSARQARTMGVGEIRAAPLPTEVFEDGGYAFNTKDVSACLRQNFQQARIDTAPRD